MDVLESINILVTISGKKNKIRVFYLSWLKNKIVKTESVKLKNFKIKLVANLLISLFFRTIRSQVSST